MKGQTHLEKILEWVKHVVYVVTLPIYLWSVGKKSLEEYIQEIENEYETYYRYKRIFTDEQFKNNFPPITTSK
jgi:hypothetical protein